MNTVLKKFAWRGALVLNVLISFLAVSYALPLLRSKGDDVDQLLGREVLGIWLYAEVVAVLLGVAVKLAIKDRRKAKVVHHG